MGPEAAVRGLTGQITIIVTVVAGAGKTESVKLHNDVIVVGITISFSPHIILNQSGIGTSTSRGWEMPAGRTDGVWGVTTSKVRVAGTGSCGDLY